jgi:hypothetical protein
MGKLGEVGSGKMKNPAGLGREPPGVFLVAKPFPPERNI